MRLVFLSFSWIFLIFSFFSPLKSSAITLVYGCEDKTTNWKDTQQQAVAGGKRAGRDPDEGKMKWKYIDINGVYKIEKRYGT